MDVEFHGTDFYGDRLPPVWHIRPSPAAAAAHGLAAALLRRSLWTGDGDSHSSPRLVDLSPESEEFRAVAAQFLSSASGIGSCLRVESILRVQNDGLLGRFLAARRHIILQCDTAGRRLDPLRAEKWLFHGPGNGGGTTRKRTSLCGGGEASEEGDAMNCILNEGFRPLLAGSRCGASYGNGPPTQPTPPLHFASLARRVPALARSEAVGGGGGGQGCALCIELL